MKEEQRKILKLVEEGMVTAEEAEELLDALETAEWARKSVHSLSTNVEWEQGERQQFQRGAAKVKNSLLSYLGEAVTKLKNIDLDFNFGTFFTVSHIFHHEAIDFSQLKVEVANGSVRLESWHEKDVRIACEAKVYQVDNQEQAREKFYQEAEFRLTGGLLCFSLPNQQVKTAVTIKIPDKEYQKINCKLFNGNLEVEGVKAGQFTGKTTNGMMMFTKTAGNYLNAETVNGSIKIEAGNWADIDVETINGKLQLDGVFEKVGAQVISGSIYCNWREGSHGHTAYLKTTTGNVRIRLPQDLKVSGQVETKIGTIHYNREECQVINEKKDKISKLLQFKANEEKEKTLCLEAETKTGSIWLLPTSEKDTV